MSFVMKCRCTVTSYVRCHQPRYARHKGVWHLHSTTKYQRESTWGIPCTTTLPTWSTYKTVPSFDKHSLRYQNTIVLVYDVTADGSMLGWWWSQRLWCSPWPSGSFMAESDDTVCITKSPRLRRSRFLWGTSQKNMLIDVTSIGWTSRRIDLCEWIQFSLISSAALNNNFVASLCLTF